MEFLLVQGRQFCQIGQAQFGGGIGKWQSLVVNLMGKVNWRACRRQPSMGGSRGLDRRGRPHAAGSYDLECLIASRRPCPLEHFFETLRGPCRYLRFNLRPDPAVVFQIAVS